MRYYKNFINPRAIEGRKVITLVWDKFRVDIVRVNIMRENLGIPSILNMVDAVGFKVERKKLPEDIFEIVKRMAI